MKPSFLRCPKLLVVLILTVWFVPLADWGANATSVVFGVVADIQYGDKDSVGSRNYRKSLQKLPECVEAFNARPLDFVIELGDLVDGYADNRGRSIRDLDAILPLLGKLRAPLYCVVGNHCVKVGRTELLKRLKLEKACYDFSLPKAPGWRFIVLDGTDPKEGEIGLVQQIWLRETLQRAQQEGQRVICFCHYPLLHSFGAGGGIKNVEPIAAILKDFPCVAGWFCGHYHPGGYVEKGGVHYVTFKGMIEAGGNAFAVVELTPGMIHIQGFGEESSRDLAVTPILTGGLRRE